MRPGFVSLLTVALVAVTALSAAAADRQIVLKEYLGQSWPPALLTYPFQATQADKCLPRNVRITGPNGPVAAQLVQVEKWPGTEFVKTARLALVSDLAPKAEKTFTVRYDTPGAAVPKTDLQVKPGTGQVEMLTRYFGLRLLLGEKTYPEPQAADQVPGPVMALAQPEAKWFGGSRLYGPKQVKAYAARLTENGPVLVEWSVRYTYEDDSTLDLTVQLAAGDARARWATNSSADSPENGWTLQINPEPLSLAVAPEFGKNKWKQLQMVGGRWDFDPVDVPLDKEPEGMVTQLTPWGDWWNGTTQLNWTFKNAAGAEVVKAEITDPGAWVVPEAPGTLRSWAAWQHKLLPLWKEADGTLTLHVDNAGGERKWLLGSGEIALGRQLDVVKDYVLEWPEDKLGHPHLFPQ